MKNFKKIFIVTALFFTGLSLFAQTSRTSSVTNSFFTTDVDKFMNVNSWSAVKAENAFMMFSGGAGLYNLGFAKQFKNIYWGSYFAGDFGNYEKTVTKTGDSTTTEKEAGTTDSTSFSFYNLLGIGNVGIRLGFYYVNRGSTVNENVTPVVITDHSDFAIYTRFGLKALDFGKYKLTPYAWFNFENNYNETAKTVTDGVVTADERVWRITGGAGGTATLTDNSANKTTLQVSLGSYLQKPRNKDLYTNDRFYVELPLNLKSVFYVNKQLSLGLGASVTPSFTYLKTSDTEKRNTINLGNTLYCGIQYDTLKKVVLNAGIDVAVPDYSLVFETDTATDTKTVTSSWNGSDASLTFSTGFQINPVKNLSFDCSWNILGAILSDSLITDFYEGSTYNFWQNFNYAFIHNISFQVSYKF